ncbi:hypothetical protein M3Y95_01208400 [Aphelenchoides besseyi]|nr:hypothetical protein M3Y95_01208400 [Aphelenchoides besseyi]
MKYFWIIAIVIYVAVLYAQNVPSTTPRTFRLYRAFDAEPTVKLASSVQCLRKRYATLFVKVFDKHNTKYSGIATAAVAKSSDYNVECIIEPDIKRLLNDKTYSPELIGAITMSLVAGCRGFWLNTTSTDVWNLSFLNVVALSALSIITTIINNIEVGIHFGIFSSYYDAVDIFISEGFVLSDELSSFNGLLMWYYLPIDFGEGNQTSADMRDYIPFLNIKKPSVKQFGRGIEIEECGVTINDNVYVA